MIDIVHLTKLKECHFGADLLPLRAYDLTTDTVETDLFSHGAYCTNRD